MDELVSFAFEIEPANIASVTPRFAIEIVLVVEISPPPVKPLPADIETAVWSMCLFAEYPVVESCETCEEPENNVLLALALPSYVVAKDAVNVLIEDVLSSILVNLAVFAVFVVACEEVNVFKDAVDA